MEEPSFYFLLSYFYASRYLTFCGRGVLLRHCRLCLLTSGNTLDTRVGKFILRILELRRLSHGLALSVTVVASRSGAGQFILITSCDFEETTQSRVYRSW